MLILVRSLFKFQPARPTDFHICANIDDKQTMEKNVQDN